MCWVRPGAVHERPRASVEQADTATQSPFTCRIRAAVFARSRYASRSAAASSSLPGMRCPYRSYVFRLRRDPGLALRARLRRLYPRKLAGGGGRRPRRTGHPLRQSFASAIPCVVRVIAACVASASGHSENSCASPSTAKIRPDRSGYAPGGWFGGPIEGAFLRRGSRLRRVRRTECRGHRRRSPSRRRRRHRLGRARRQRHTVVAGTRDDDLRAGRTSQHALAMGADDGRPTALTGGRGEAGWSRSRCAAERGRPVRQPPDRRRPGRTVRPVRRRGGCL
jgi:hypothetical protein